MPAVDIDRLPPEQAQAWRRLWDTLLTTGTNEETRNGGSLATDTATGKQATDIAATGRNDSRSER